MQEFPLTLAYGKSIDALRRRYPDLLWHGEFRHTQGAKVFADGEPVDHYSVFVDRQSNRRAVVVVNPKSDDELKISVKIANATSMISATPEDPAPSISDGQATLPPLSAVVFMEQK